MKLNKDTKHAVSIGTILKDGTTTYIVTNRQQYPRGNISVTLEDVKTKQHIYMIPISQCYGMEILKDEIMSGLYASAYQHQTMEKYGITADDFLLLERIKRQ